MGFRKLAIVGAATTAVAAGAIGWALSAGASGNSDAAPVASTITLVNSNPPETFAPPPQTAAVAALTAQQAADVYAESLGHSPVDIPSDVSVSLGSLTIPVGPDCGAECENGNTVSNGIAYTALNELAYGYAVTTCSQGSSLPADQCTQWLFLDANTGKLIIEIGPAMSTIPDQSPSPSATG